MAGGGARLGRRRGPQPPVRGSALGHAGHEPHRHRRDSSERRPAAARTPPSPSRSPADEITIHHHIPTTTPARTLLDLAAVIPKHSLDRALDEAEVLRLPGPTALLDRHPRSRGTATLRTLLLDPRAPTPTRTDLEARFLSFLDDHGFDRPQINTFVEGNEVDAVWREARLIVELDGFATHGTRRAFERDRVRDRRLTAAGWRVVRITWRGLEDRRELAGELRRLRAPRIDPA